MPRYIPQELVDLIIDHASDSVPQLQTWTVVSRACLYSARRRLFSSIVIPGREQAFGPPSIGSLMSATPSVCTLVRKLALGVSKSTVPFHLAFTSFFEVLQRLPCLSVLNFENVVFTESPDGQEYIATSSRPSTRLEHLVFSRCGIDLTGLISIVSRFDTITSLGIFTTQDSPAGNLLTGSTERASFITGATRVQCLSLYKTSVEDLRSFGEAIDLEHLQHVILVMDMQNGETEILRVCKNLKRLQVLIYRTYILNFSFSAYSHE